MVPSQKRPCGGEGLSAMTPPKSSSTDGNYVLYTFKKPRGRAERDELSSVANQEQGKMNSLLSMTAKI
jgi:hypothetical protein